MPELTFVIPVAEYHKDMADNAIASVQAQTIPCELIAVADKHGKGAGWARNRGLESVNTPYVSFLDADDTIDPRFAETCLRAIAPQHYVYTDWQVDGQHISAPEPCILWTRKTFHVVTTLMRTEDALRIGGYDELLPGAEDTDFGLRLRLSGICGIRIPEPLFNWGDGGLRSKELRASGKEVTVVGYFNERYKEYPLMGCCGDNNLQNNAPGNEPQPGWVLVQALWAGNRQEWGRATGILYPRTGNMKTLYIDPRDAAAMPDKYRPITSAQTVNGVVLQPQYQPRNDWQHVVSAWQGGAQAVPPAQPSSPIEYKPLVNTHSQQDILSKVKK